MYQSQTTANHLVRSRSFVIAQARQIYLETPFRILKLQILTQILTSIHAENVNPNHPVAIEMCITLCKAHLLIK